MEKKLNMTSGLHVSGQSQKLDISAEYISISEQEKVALLRYPPSTSHQTTQLKTISQ